MRTVTRDEILRIITSNVRARMDELGDKETPVDEDTSLLGSEGVLDSLGLATVLLDIEDELRNAMDKNVVLASEQALSRSTSPFRKVQALTDYVVELLSG